MIFIFLNILFLPTFLFCECFVTYQLRQEAPEKAAITYALNQGRFGDNLISYLCAKQFSLLHGIELLYVPFQYSDQLKLHTIEKQFSDHVESFEEKILYNHKDAADYSDNEDILYVTDWHHQPMLDMYNETVKKVARNLIASIFKISYIDLLPNSISVAVHMRSGKGYDQEKTRKKHPHRFLPLHYFSDQIKRILFMFPEKRLFVYVFTDDPNPEHIISYLQHNASSDLITYDYRKTANFHDQHVLEDFFNMMRFDVLIRPASNFSGLSQYSGNHKVVILPEELHFIDEKSWYVDTVQIVIKINGKHKIFGNVRSSASEMPVISK